MSYFQIVTEFHSFFATILTVCNLLLRQYKNKFKKYQQIQLYVNAYTKYIYCYFDIFYF